jgi:hypothetical protein
MGQGNRRPDCSLPCLLRLGGAGRVRNRASGRPATLATDPHWLQIVTWLNSTSSFPDLNLTQRRTALWNETGNFIGTALAQMERGKAFSIMLGRLQRELREAYGAENARRVLQAIMDTME